MPPLSMLIKPASSICNMKCRYCFYCDEAKNRSVVSYGIMSEETAEIIIRRAFEEAEQYVTFAFQGGEPTCAGFDFFLFFINKAKELNKKNIDINYTIQTNGLFADRKKWASFFSENNFLVGLSFDGTREDHDLNRIDSFGAGTASRVIACSLEFNRYNVAYNILTVVNSATVRHAAKIYQFYKKQNWKYMQFIPCLSPFNSDDKNYAPSNEAWENFNKTLFDLWYDDVYPFLSKGKEPDVSIRHFDDYLRAAAGVRTTSCGTCGICAVQYVIESDGGVYPCDFWALDKYKLGNIRKQTFTEIAQENQAKEFIEVSRHHSNKCINCDWYSICRGGCFRFKKNNEYIYCEAYKNFYKYTYTKITELAKLLNRG